MCTPALTRRSIGTCNAKVTVPETFVGAVPTLKSFSKLDKKMAFKSAKLDKKMALKSAKLDKKMAFKSL